MDKRQLIDEIRSFNPTAQAQFLAQFDERALVQYLDHLQAARNKVIRIGGWVKRREETPLRKAS
ncbi:MAG TPA: hypothetical protein VGG19_17610 [Tepidisphaeraceae bacterium]|jgi:hypothetical protein